MTMYSFEQELLNVKDHIDELINKSGACIASKAMQGMKSGVYDTQEFFKIIDFLIKNKLIECLNKGVAGQNEIYIKCQ